MKTIFCLIWNKLAKWVWHKLNARSQIQFLNLRTDGRGKVGIEEGNKLKGRFDWTEWVPF